MPKTTLGELEFLVLLAILRLGDSAYGVPIAREIDRRIGRDLSRATIYVTLQRMEEYGLVCSEMSEPRDAGGGRARRYYRVLDPGLELARRSKAAYSTMWEGLAALEESTS